MQTRNDMEKFGKDGKSFWEMRAKRIGSPLTGLGTYVERERESDVNKEKDDGVVSDLAEMAEQF